MKPEKKYSLIHKYLSKQINASEKEEVEVWMKHSKSAQKEFDAIQNIWEQSEKIDFDLDPATDAEWAKLRQKAIGKTTKSLKTSSYRWIAVAAAVVMLLGGFWLVQQFGTTTDSVAQSYVTQAGETQEIILADGSKVVLNAASQLNIGADYDVNNRIVKLEGEAWFEVTKQKEGQPFTVQMEVSEVKVLGTQFNVQAYPNFQTSTVQVAEGKVVYSTRDKQTALLTAGQAAVYDKSTQKLSSKSIVGDVGAWQRGVIVFDEQPLSEVFATLERKFAVTINDQTTLGKEPYSGDFDNEEIKDILQVISLSYGFSIAQDGKTIILTK